MLWFSSRQTIWVRNKQDTELFVSLQSEPAKHGKELIPGTYIISAIHRNKLTQEELGAITTVTGRWPTETLTFTMLFHRWAVFHSAEYGRSDGRWDSTVCTFFHGESKPYGTIEKFCLTESKHLVLIRPFKVNGSLLHAAGVPGRQKLQNYRLWSAQVDKVQHPCIAVELQALTGKCLKIKKRSRRRHTLFKFQTILNTIDFVVDYFIEAWYASLLCVINWNYNLVNMQGDCLVGRKSNQEWNICWPGEGVEKKKVIDWGRGFESCSMAFMYILYKYSHNIITTLVL